MLAHWFVPLFAGSRAQASPQASTGGSAKGRRRIISPAYAPVPAPEYWAAKEKRRRRNVALLLALGH